MSENPVENISPMDEGISPSGGRKKQKIRIKYQERVRIKKRPEGNKFTRYWKKHKKSIIAATVLFTLLGYTIFMIGKMINHRLEMNKYQKDIKQEIP